MVYYFQRAATGEAIVCAFFEGEDIVGRVDNLGEDGRGFEVGDGRGSNRRVFDVAVCWFAIDRVGHDSGLGDLEEVGQNTADSACDCRDFEDVEGGDFVATGYH